MKWFLVLYCSRIKSFFDTNFIEKSLYSKILCRVNKISVPLHIFTFFIYRRKENHMKFLLHDAQKQILILTNKCHISRISNQQGKENIVVFQKCIQCLPSALLSNFVFFHFHWENILDFHYSWISQLVMSPDKGTVFYFLPVVL